MAEWGIQGRLDEVGEDTVSGGIGAARMFAAVVRDLAKQDFSGGGFLGGIDDTADNYDVGTGVEDLAKQKFFQIGALCARHLG